MSFLTTQVQHCHFICLIRLEQFGEMSRARSEIEDRREFFLYILVSVSATSYEEVPRINTSHKSLYHRVGYVITNVVNCSAAASPIASGCTIFLQALCVSVKNLIWTSRSSVDMRR